MVATDGEAAYPALDPAARRDLARARRAELVAALRVQGLGDVRRALAGATGLRPRRPRPRVARGPAHRCSPARTPTSRRGRATRTRTTARPGSPPRTPRRSPRTAGPTPSGCGPGSRRTTRPCRGTGPDCSGSTPRPRSPSAPRSPPSPRRSARARTARRPCSTPACSRTPDGPRRCCSASPARPRRPCRGSPSSTRTARTRGGATPGTSGASAPSCWRACPASATGEPSSPAAGRASSPSSSPRAVTRCWPRTRWPKRSARLAHARRTSPASGSSRPPCPMPCRWSRSTSRSSVRSSTTSTTPLCRPRSTAPSRPSSPAGTSRWCTGASGRRRRHATRPPPTGCCRPRPELTPVVEHVDDGFVLLVLRRR